MRPGVRRDEARGGGNQIQAHEFEVLVRQKAVREAAGTGEGQLLAARQVAEAIVDAFRVGPPATVAAVDGVIGSSAEIDQPDTDPNRNDALEVGARVTVFTNGDVLAEEDP